MRSSGAPAPASPLAQEVRAGLSRRPKALSPWLFYDAAGSALFEEITRLPEYYLTRTEQRILDWYADTVAEAAGPEVTLVELGAGTARKTRTLITALLRRQPRLHYFPLDVSAAALGVAARQLHADFPALHVEPIVTDYTRDAGPLARLPGRRLVLFLGSSIGNYEPAAAGALLGGLRAHALRPGDALLVGTDLAKSAELLLPAYDDAAGVTARFNKNVLVRINRELGGDFDPGRFDHVALWNAAASRVEMHLESRRRQRVRVGALGLEVVFDRQERLHTESSYKFTRSMLAQVVLAAGLRLERTWTDHRGWFALHLLRV
ncbi:MAG TPA: L-histidine N(alpha)-methyltransferase [Polyangia bacterium]|jgi:dimethylhistidine N-methyltransferase